MKLIALIRFGVKTVFLNFGPNDGPNFLSKNPKMARNSAKLNGLNFGPSQAYMHIPPDVNISFEDFFGHLSDPSVCFVRKLFSYDEQ